MTHWQNLDTLTLWERNYNRGDVPKIKASIRRYGFNNALRLWQGKVMAGNHSTLALRELRAEGWDNPHGGALKVKGDVWQVDTVALDHLSEIEAEAFAVADNHVAALATPDETKLAEVLESIKNDAPDALNATGFDEAALGELLARLGDDAVEGNPSAQLDRATELKQKYGVERGQVWLIGRHRLMCGDSYNPEHIARLMDGKQADMLHTDPPYGINIVKPQNGFSTADSGGAKPFGSTAASDRKGKSAIAFRNGGRAERVHPPNIIQSNLYPVIEGDDTPFDPALFTDFAPVVIMWGANYYADKLPVKACWIVWDKREDITRNNFADCELAWTNQNSPARVFHHLWNGLHKGSQHGERRIHPTEKPVALFEEIGKLFCPDGLWVDLFAGSGAQLVAAERAGTSCYAMEYEPLYVACVLERLADLGLEPRLSETELTHA